ncbi:zinc-binding dehydrogenase [Tardiphaga sp.]|uniref:zinc-binding dehydrogenase n=1 Tax=Tardiphaga sp. TaxID=1926292 RepID=UPI002611EC13|nr:zinc-binding dehydrogenase [Tardiphaga sp.]
MLGATVSGSCSEQSLQRAEAMGMESIYDYGSADLSGIGVRFDVVYDTAGTMPVTLGIGLLRKGGVFLDIDPTPAKFLRALFNRRLKPIICTARAEILDGLAQAAGSKKLRLPIAESVHLTEAIPLLTALERGRKLPGKAVVAID